MDTRLCRIVFALALGLILSAGLALAAHGAATPFEQVAAPSEPHVAHAPGLASPISPMAAPTLTLAIAPSNHFPAPGDTLRYSITLRNTGDAAAPAATLSNALPSGLDFVTGTLAATAGAASYSPAGRRVSWAGDLAAGARVTLTYAAVLNTADTIYNTAVLTHPLAAAPAGATSSPADIWGAAETVDVSHVFDGDLGSWRYIAVDSGGTPHIAYGGDRLYYASLVGGSWVSEAVPVTPTGVSAAALILDAADRPQIAFAASSAIWLARQTSEGLAATWTLERVAAPAWDSFFRGLLDLAAGADGRLHLVYNNTSGELYYTVREASGWLSPTLAFTSTGCNTSYLGFDPTRDGFSLAVDASNVARLACVQNNTQPREVRFYTATVAGPWTTYEVVTRTTPNVQWFYHPSLTYDGATPHLSFAAYEAYGLRLYHAWSASPWQTERVDAWPDITYLPRSTAIAVRGGQLAIAWSIWRQSRQLAAIRFAARDLAGGAWITRTLDSFGWAGNSNLDAPRPTLALAPAGQAHVAYYYAPEQTLRHAGQPAGWAIQTVDEGRTVGSNAVIAVEPGGRLHVAYPSAGIRYAVSERNTSTWTKTVVAIGPYDSLNAFVDLAVDAGGAPHILYGGRNAALYHATAPAGASAGIAAAAWITRPVDASWRGEAGPALALGAAGVAHAAYLAGSGANTALRHATFDGARWVTETLAVVGPDGWGPQIVAQAGAVHVLYLDCTASQPNGDYPINLALRTLTGGAWRSRTVTMFTGVCDWRIAYELVADGGRLAATLSRQGLATQTFWINDAGITTAGAPAATDAPAGAFQFGDASILSEARCRLAGVVEGCDLADNRFAPFDYGPRTTAALRSGCSADFCPESEMRLVPGASRPAGDAPGASMSAAAPEGLAGSGWSPVSGGRGPGIELIENKNGHKTVTYVDGAGYRSEGIPVGPLSGYLTDLSRSGHDAAVTEVGYDNSLRVERTRRQALCCLTMKVAPDDAAQDGCKATASAYTMQCGAQPRVDAIGANGWAFLNWIGPVQPSDQTPGLTTVTGREPNCTEVTADFVKQTAVKADRPEFYQNAPTVIALGEELTYIITLYYNGTAATAPGTMNDPIPEYTDYIPGTAHATLGLVQYVGDQDTGAIQWAGDMPADQEVVITWKVRVDKAELPAKRTEWPAKIVNRATAVIRGITYPLARETILFNPMVNTTSDQVLGVVGDGVCGQTGAACSLREALLETGAHPNRGAPDVISFDIPGSGQEAGDRDQGTADRAAAPVIALTAALPTVRDPVVIDGTTQAGGFVRVDGGRRAMDGLTISAGGSTVQGLELTGFGATASIYTGAGIVIEGPAGGNQIQHNRIGRLTPLHNMGPGVRISNSPNNTLSDNTLTDNGYGVLIQGATATGNALVSNRIGTDGVSADPLGNDGAGVWIWDAPGNTVGGSVQGAGNLIAGNKGSGVFIQGAAARDNVIIGNAIGVQTYGAGNQGNGLDGVEIEDASGTRVGGLTAGERNVIAWNRRNGVQVRGANATDTHILGNLIGIEAPGNLPLGANNGNGVLITGGAHDNWVGGDAAGSRNTIGNNKGHGVAILAGAGGNHVLGNVLGHSINRMGELEQWWALPNEGDGIRIENSAGNVIGGAAGYASNVIARSKKWGIQIIGAASSDNRILGNYVGLAADGETCFSNESGAIRLSNAGGNRVGDANPDDRNVISNRVQIYGAAATGNRVQGNFIGLRPDGYTCSCANNNYGVMIEDAPANLIGGETAAARNVIACNKDNLKIVGQGATGNLALNNFIGANRDGTFGPGIGPYSSGSTNSEVGVRIIDAPGNIIGRPGQGNLISAHLYDGIVIKGPGATGNRIQANTIGAQIYPDRPLLNARHGVLIDGANDTWIGGIGPGEGNLIAFNQGDGVNVAAGERNRILGNTIFANEELGIDLLPEGPTPNDPGDPDPGPNRLQNTPILTTTATAGGMQVDGILDSLPGRAYRLEFFDNPQYKTYQGERFLGSRDVTTGGGGLARFTATFAGASAVIAATATDPDGNTSEFAMPPIVVNMTSDEEDAAADDGMCDVDGSRDGPQCTLRAALAEANRRRGQDAILFAIPGAGVPVIQVTAGELPVIYTPLILDGATQPGAGRVTIDGSAAPLDAAGFVVRRPATGVELRSLTVTGFAGSGVYADGASLILDRMEILANGRYGVLGSGRRGTFPVIQFRHWGRVNGNGSRLNGIVNEAAIMVEGGVSVLEGIEFLEVADNKRSGIIVALSNDAYLTLENARVLNNKADGIELPAALGCSELNLYGWIEVTGNDGYGIRNSCVTNVNADRLEVTGNGKSGIWSENNFIITDEGDYVQIVIRGNGRLVGAEEDAAGIEAKGPYATLDLAPGRGAVEIAHNFGYGVLAELSKDASIALANANVHHNTADGLRVGNAGEIALLDTVLINDNDADGLHTISTPVRLHDLERLEVARNGGWGLAVGGEIALSGGSSGYAQITVKGNGHKIAGTGGIALTRNLAMGGRGHRLEISGNIGDGIRQTSAAYGVYLDRTRVISNTGDGIDARGAVDVSGANSISYNNGWGIRVRGELTTRGAQISGNGLGAILRTGVGVETEQAAAASENSSSVTFSQITDNAGDGLRLELSTTLTVTGTNIAGNAGWGVNNAVTETFEVFGNLKGLTLDARGVWWGDASGPGGAGPGGGDAVSAGVTFTPWRTTPVALVALPAADPLLAPIGVPITAAVYLRNWVAPTDTVRVQFRDAAGWLVAPTVVTVTLSDEELGGTAYVTITVPAGTPVGASDVITATATSQVSPTMTITAVFRVQAARMADLSLEMRGSASAVMSGEPIAYTLVVRNAGPHAATGVTLTDTLPVSATLLSAAPAQGTCSGAATVICNLGTLAAGAATTVTLTTRPIASGALWNTAVVTAGELDPDPWDNADVAVTQVWIEERRVYLPLVLRRR